jgi:hypothetical protein
LLIIILIKNIDIVRKKEVILDLINLLEIIVNISKRKKENICDTK